MGKKVTIDAFTFDYQMCNVTTNSDSDNTIWFKKINDVARFSFNDYGYSFNVIVVDEFKTWFLTDITRDDWSKMEQDFAYKKEITKVLKSHLNKYEKEFWKYVVTHALSVFDLDHTTYEVELNLKNFSFWYVFSGRSPVVYFNIEPDCMDMLYQRFFELNPDNIDETLKKFKKAEFEEFAKKTKEEYGENFENANNKINEYKLKITENINSVRYNELNSLQEEKAYIKSLIETHNDVSDVKLLKHYQEILIKKENAIDDAYNKYLAKTEIGEFLKNLKEKYGKEFENFDSKTGEYKSKITEKINPAYYNGIRAFLDNPAYYNGTSAFQKVKLDIKSLIEKYPDVPDVDLLKQYQEILTKKENAIIDAYDKYLQKELGSIPDKKLEFLDKLDVLSFNDSLSMYKMYSMGKEKDIIQIDSFLKSKTKLNEYEDFYRYSSILLSDHMNKISYNKSKNKFIPQNDINNALMYFYETDSLDKINDIILQKDYLESKKGGIIGEKEVSRALKWLDKSYVSVPKTSSGKYGEKALILYNPEFIDEPQEYDHVVIGKQGVFLIETKNYAGKLIVDKNGNWIRIKSDGSEEGERNPIQQLRRHEKLLRSIIGENIEIISVICMAHPKMIIEGVENCSVPLVKSDMLVEFIEKYETTSALSDEKIKDCLHKIEEYIKK